MMKNSYRKIFIIVPAIIVSLIFASPWISLILPEELRDHAYYFLGYKIIADRQTRGLKDKNDITIALFHYVRNSIFVPAGLVPYEDKPFVFLINGTGWCDYNARLFTKLLAQKNIPARYVFLKDKDGNSPHTMAEVYLDEKWRIIDPAAGLIFFKGKDFATIDDLSGNPKLIFKHPKLLAVKERNEEEFKGIVQWYSSMFPVPQEPQRSSSKTRRITPFDRVMWLNWYIFGDNFANTYQDFYLNLKTSKMHSQAEKMFYRARNYDLFNRIYPAVAIYKDFIKNSPGSKYAEDSLFFLSLTCIKDVKNYQQAEKLFNLLLARFPESRWKKIVYYYLYLCNNELRIVDEANKYYLLSHWELLDIPY